MNSPAKTPPPELTRIGAYRILSAIAAGGMGVVYRAEHLETGARVAIKTVRAYDAELFRGIRREIHALRRVDHPGVVRIVDEGTDEGAPWYAMELLEGRTLRSFCAGWWRNVPDTERANALIDDHQQVTRVIDTERDEAPPVVAPPVERIGYAAANGHLLEALGLLRGLCAALAYLHGEGIIHRDLKPDNVIVRSDGTPVLVDFGLVTSHRGGSGRESLEVAGTLEGSYGYMSPEQITGQLLDARSDLYSLGCVLFELLTGRLPFQGEGMTMLRSHLSDEPAPPSFFVSGIPPALDTLVLRLLEKRPSDRLGFAGDIDAELERLGALLPSFVRVPEARSYLYRTEFVGRDHLLDQLYEGLSQTARGEGRLVLIRGESGAGKTRLATELGTLANARGIRVLTGECSPVGTTAGDQEGVHGKALHPFRSLLQSITDYCRANGEEETRKLLGDGGAVLATYEPSLASVTGVEPIQSLPRVAPQAARERLFQALDEALTSYSAIKPLLLVLDDLQWADELSTSALAALARGVLARVPVMILATYRDDEATPAIEELRSVATELMLDRLDEQSIATLAARMLALRSLPTELARFLSDRSSGNPFFVAEYLRAAVAARLLVRQKGEWSLSLPGARSSDFDARLPLPRSLRELIMSRLGGLSPRARALVEVAAVLGREWSADLLAAVAGIADFDELEATEELLSRRVLDDAGSGRLRFVHDKLRETVYDAIVPDRLRSLHRGAGEVFHARRTQGERLDRSLAEVGNHFLLGGVVEKAFEYFAEAGEEAHRMGAHADAVAHLERARSLGKDMISRDRLVRWERMVSESYFALGEMQESAKHATNAIALVGRPLPATSSEWGKLLAREMAVQTLHRWRPPRVSPAPAQGDAARAAGILAECLYWRQESLPMTSVTFLAVNLAEQAGLPGEVRREYAKLAYLVGLGRMHGLARSYFDTSQQSLDRHDDASSIAFAHFIESMYHVVFCSWDRARDSSSRAVEQFRSLGDAQGLELSETMRAQSEFYCGDFAATLPRFQAVRRSAQARGNKVHDAWGAYAAGRSLIPLGRHEDAIDLLREASGLLQGLGDRPSEMITHGLLAQALLVQGDEESAYESACKARELWTGAEPTVYSEWHGHEGAAQVFLARWRKEPRSRFSFGRSESEVGARDACKVLSKFAMTFPLARPAAMRCEASVALASGDAKGAKSKWEKSVALAQEQQMPFEELQSCMTLASEQAMPKSTRALYLLRAQNLSERLRNDQFREQCQRLQREF